MNVALLGTAISLANDILTHPHLPGEETIPMRDRRATTNGAAQEPALMTFKEAMDFLRVSRSTLYRLMWSGQLRGYKVGSAWRFYHQDLLDAVATPATQRRNHDHQVAVEGE